MPMSKRQNVGMQIIGDAARGQVGLALVRAQIAERRDARQLGPVNIGTPGRCGRVAASDHDEALRWQLRQKRLAQPAI